MDSLQLREMLIQIGERTPCPFCKTKIPMSGISIEPEKDLLCFIRFSCPKCKEEFAGQAMMKKIKTPIGKKLNASSLVEMENNFQEEVSTTEVQGMNSILLENISFSTIFSQKKQ